VSQRTKHPRARRENVPGLAGRSVGMASRNNYLFTADQWSPTYRMAPLSDLSHWAEISPPAARPFTMELTAYGASGAPGEL